jgi:urease accessory protein
MNSCSKVNERVPISEVGRRGRMELRLASANGRTVMSRIYAEVPFKVTRLHETDSPGWSHLVLMHSTAGVFGGDVLESSIHVESGARILITQQSAAKIHPSGGRPAIQVNRLRVDSGGELCIFYEPVIPFAESHLNQRTIIELAEGARLTYWEGFMAGRIGRGETWKFNELSSETSIRKDGRLLYLDRLRITPAGRRPVSAWEMAGAGYWGTGLCFGASAPGLVQSLHEALPDAGVDTPVPELAVVRVLERDGQKYHEARQAFLDHADSCRAGL